MQTMNELGAAIHERRRTLGITQEQLAFTVGVNRRVIGEIERGKPTARMDIVLRTVDA
ncbi:MAG: Y4mF family transcriptional regulator, partial [Thermoleophilia bacterium]|nr:Y4mF family transcriptional regulator [Thermoleophilia bacterium]